MPFKEVFNRYFKRKLIIYGSITLIVFLVRYYKRPVEWELTIGFCLFILLAVIITGLFDYRFYEKHIHKIIDVLLNSAPLAGFTEIGFINEEQKLLGSINDFRVILSPYSNVNGTRFLIILIPIQPREGLEEYVKTLNGTFRLSYNGGSLICAQATLKNYEKNFDFTMLFELIRSATAFLKEKAIKPIEIAE